MNRYFSILFMLLCGTSLCAQQSTNNTQVDNKQWKHAQKLAQKYIIVDGHVDLPYRLKVTNFRFQKELIDIPIQTSEGDFDYVRARQGGLNAPFMSIFLPSRTQSNDGEARLLADSLIDMIERVCREHPKYFEVAYSPQDVERIAKKDKIALPMGMENGAGIEDKLDLINHFKQRGISYITLTHAKDNRICDSSYDTTRTWNGLSPFGEQVVQRMNDVGIMVDISHVSDSTFYQVLRVTHTPVIASHSSARAFVPGFERNMSDEMIRAMKKNNGVIMINFGSTFLDAAVVKQREELKNAVNNALAERNLTIKDEEAASVIDAIRQNYPHQFADVQMVANHIDLVVKLAGVDHVGFGSDFDGVGDSLPTGLKDVSQYPNLIYELIQRGYSDEDIEKMCSKNLFRVWNEVLNHAKSHNK